MEIPWETIVGAAGSSAVVVVLGVIFAQKVIEKVVDTSAKGVEAALARAEETHKKQLELAGGIDLDLRKQRMEAYEKIWKKTRLLPKWPRPADVSHEQLHKLGEDLRDWYYDGGGMFLSTKAREAFGLLQDSIQAASEGKKTGSLSPTEYETVRLKCSEFRTEITNDLLSRRAAPLPRA
jgi:hypothetical protein